jgi:hypothetical protein
MIDLTCPTCGNWLSAPDEMAGQTTDCSCGERILLPRQIGLSRMPTSRGAAPDKILSAAKGRSKRIWFGVLLIGIAGIVLSALLLVVLMNGHKLLDQQIPAQQAVVPIPQFNPNDIEETARWVELLRLQEAEALGDVDPHNPLAARLFGDRVKAHLSKHTGQTVSWKLIVNTTFDYRGSARASLQRDFRGFTVHSPDVVAVAKGQISNDDAKVGHDFIPMSATQFLKLKKGTVVLVTGKIWFATVDSMNLRNCNAQIADQD